MEIKKATLDGFEEVLELKLKLKEYEREFNKNLLPVSKATLCKISQEIPVK